MRVGIIGVGHIGGNCARQFARVGHEVLLSFSRAPDRLDALAGELGHSARAVDVRSAVTDADLTVIAVPWRTLDEVLEAAGPFDGRIVIDTTNQFGAGGVVDLDGRTAARFNADRMRGARYTKSFNTLTAAFQAEVATRRADERVVQWVCGDDADAKSTVSALIADIGYEPVDLGGVDDCAVMEAPRRDGAVYGEEYRRADALAVVAALQAGAPLPPVPEYPPPAPAPTVSPPGVERGHTIGQG